MQRHRLVRTPLSRSWRQRMMMFPYNTHKAQSNSNRSAAHDLHRVIDVFVRACFLRNRDASGENQHSTVKNIDLHDRIGSTQRNIDEFDGLEQERILLGLHTVQQHAEVLNVAALRRSRQLLDLSSTTVTTEMECFRTVLHPSQPCKQTGADGYCASLSCL